ncbi:MAG: HK97 family phage prohead protease [Acidobacteriaceae bacterium]|nr:HK97 family phage prohead protease [Acidobacteriaceae bacterium]
MKIERRNITTEFRLSEADNKTTISGYAAVFSSPASNGLWTETLDPHCFNNVLATNPDVRGLWNHNPDHVLGRTTSGTLTLALDARGLSYVIDPPDTTVANDLIVSMRRKDVTGSSFGFVTKRDQWTDQPDGSVLRTILEIEQLLDVSPVTYPFYGAANANVRSLPDSCPAEFRSRFEQRSEEVTKPESLVQHEDEWKANADLLLRLAEAS